jgi:cell division topological specificity factor
VLEFLRRLFAPEPRSSDTAKERLRLVLLSDHLSLAPEVVEALKSDLLAVISRYLEIDSAAADVTFEQREREVAMLASIPIMGVRERPGAGAIATPGATLAPLPSPARPLAVAPPLPLAPPAARETEPVGAAPEDSPRAAIAVPTTEHSAAEAGSEGEQTACVPDSAEPDSAPQAAGPVSAPEAEPPVPAPDADRPNTAPIEASLALAAPERMQGTSSSARRRRRKKAAAAAKRSPQGHAAPGFGPA